MDTLGFAQFKGSTPVGMRRLVMLAAALSLAACSLDKQTMPPLAGPSELGLSLSVDVTPDVITQDGASVATVTVRAKDASGQPRQTPLQIRAETYVGGVPVDFGVLSTKVANIDTATGEARFTYRAPAAPPPTQPSDVVVTIVVIPVGENYAGTVSRQAELRLARPGVIGWPTQGPRPSFFFSPTSPREEDDVYFDASASTSDVGIAEYAWNFGNGKTHVSASPTVRHNFWLAGTYRVVLTVTDTMGRSASSEAVTVTVASIADPTAEFVASPASPRAHIDVVNFNASASKAAPGRRIVEYSFDFGDGSPIVAGSSAIAQHRYGAAKTYTVTLRVKDDMGRFGVATQSVAVSEP